jgi:hypothetical protein
MHPEGRIPEKMVHPATEYLKTGKGGICLL